ncbi:hypothetical protein NQZ79_g2576 [Umbelopsis isabellina]|nr:hypothetical protein NQZ79_g2576 [Umbelopsis isabellina]
MRGKALLILFSAYLISCSILAVSAFTFGSSDKKDLGAQGIVKLEEDNDDYHHKHDHGDDGHGKLDDDHGHDNDDHGEHDDDHGHGHGDNNCSDKVSRTSVSVFVGGKAYCIPCGTGAVDINSICSDACDGVTASETATLVFGTGTGAITSVVACGTGTNIIPLQSLCAQDPCSLCPTPDNGQATCVSGTCGYSCNSGYAACNDTCVNDQTDINNCGACGNLCSNPTNGQATCISGAYRYQ